jgi:hypothetical protein
VRGEFVVIGMLGGKLLPLLQWPPWFIDGW